MNDLDVLTKDEVAAALQCDVLTVEEKARNGELPGIKVGRCWVFPREAMIERLNEMAHARRNRGAGSRAASMQDRIDAREESRGKPASLSMLRRRLSADAP